MLALNTAVLVLHVLTIVFSLVMVVLILWQDSRSTVNLIFAGFILMVMTWIGGTLVAHFAAAVSAPESVTAVGVRLLEIGFTGACVGLYLFTLLLTGGGSPRLMRLAILGAALVMSYQLVLAFATGLPAFNVRADGALEFAFNNAGALLYAAFCIATLIVAWQRQRKIKRQSMLWGIYLFCGGILIELVSPELRGHGIGATVSGLATLGISYTMLRVQIIDPLAGRAAQLQAVRDVGLAITSRLRLEDVLQSIAEQAVQILKASGAAIFLNQDGGLWLAAEYNMARKFRGHQLALGEGLSGRVAVTRQAARVENYQRDWSGAPDVPYAKEGFGSVVAAPLVFNDEVMGVLLVAEGVHGKRFDRDDVQLLELLGPQAAVAISNSRLFENQRRLSEELALTTEQLKESDRLKDQMIQMTSHQLKNPLFAAMSSLELLREELADQTAAVPDRNGSGLTEQPVLNGQISADLHTIWFELERMNRIVQNILNFERISSGRLAYLEFEVKPTLRGIVAEFTPQAEAKRIQLSLDAPDDLPPLTGDPHFLEQALANLIENAIKFTPEGGRVGISVAVPDDALVITVRDTGVGIPPEALSRVFERFFRANQPGTAHIAGSGLGLSLVKAVVDAHGGRIWLESEVGRGTVFYMALPVGQDRPAAQAEQTGQSK